MNQKKKISPPLIKYYFTKRAIRYTLGASREYKYGTRELVTVAGVGSQYVVIQEMSLFLRCDTPCQG